MGSWSSDQGLCPGLHPVTQVGKEPGCASGDQLWERHAT